MPKAKIIKTVYVEQSLATQVPREQIWELVAATNALNRSLNLPKIEFSDSHQRSDGKIVRTATARIAGIKLSWTEYPFEWVRLHWYAVLREFAWGPIAQFFGGVEIHDIDANTRTVKVFVRLSPSATWLRPFVWCIASVAVSKTKRHFANQLQKFRLGHQRRIGHLASKSPKVNLTVLDQRLAALAKEHTEVSRDFLEQIYNMIRQSDDEYLSSIKAIALARDLKMDERLTVKAMILAARFGLFQLEWSLVCPHCRVAKQTVNSLASLRQNFACDMCNLTYDSDFDSAVELRFSVHPSIRSVDTDTYCIGTPANFPHIVAQINSRPVAERSLEISRAAKGLLVRRLGDNTNFLRLEIGKAAVSTEELRLKIDNSGLHFQGGHLPNGNFFQLTIANETERAEVVKFEDPAPYDDRLTGLKLLAYEGFSPSLIADVLPQDLFLKVKYVCLMFTDLKQSTRTYQEYGDAKAYDAVAKHFEYLFAIIEQNRGGVVKTIGDAVMAVFLDPSDAVRAVSLIQMGMEDFNKQLNFPVPLVIKAGIHAGPAIVVAANQANDFFGKTVNLCVRLQEASEGRDCIISQMVFDQSRAVIIDSGLSVQNETIDAHGFSEPVSAVRLKFS